MRLLVNELLMKQIKFSLAFGIAVAWVSSNAVSAQVLNSFVERAQEATHDERVCGPAEESRSNGEEQSGGTLADF